MIKQLFYGVVAFTLSQTSLYALPLGNPLDATWLTDGLLWDGISEEEYEEGCICWLDAWSLRVGYYGDFVFDRRLEVDAKPNKSDIRKTRLFTNAAYFAFNLWDKYDLFATIGQTKFHVESPASAFDFTVLGALFNDRAEFETETNFSWSAGVRATIWQCGPLGLGGEFQYFHTRPRLNYFEVPSFNTFYFNHLARTNYREYQVGLGATCKLCLAGCDSFVVPYFGAKWSHARFNLDNFLIQMSGLVAPGSGIMHNLESHHHWGAILGLTLVGCTNWSLTAEARFSDELALHINSQLRF